MFYPYRGGLRYERSDRRWSGKFERLEWRHDVVVGRVSRRWHDWKTDDSRRIEARMCKKGDQNEI
jgi:hypothetical protein